MKKLVAILGIILARKNRAWRPAIAVATLLDRAAAHCLSGGHSPTSILRSAWNPGGGLPGIPLAIADPRLHVTLLDANGKLWPQVREAKETGILMDVGHGLHNLNFDVARKVLEIERVERALPGFRIGTSDTKEYQTLAGFVVKHLGHLPKEGETFEQQGYVFEVLDMDRHRVDKVLVVPLKP